MKKEIPIIVVLLLVILLLLGSALAAVFYVLSPDPASGQPGGNTGLAGFFQGFGLRNAAPPESVVVDYMKTLDTGANGEPFTVSTDGSRLYLDCEPSTPEGRFLFSFLQGAWSFPIDRAETEGLTSKVNVYITCPDTALFEEPLKNKTSEILAQKVEKANSIEEIYDEAGQFRKEVTDEAFWSALGSVCADARQLYSVKLSVTLNLEFYQKQWHITNPAGLNNTLDMRVQALHAAAVDQQPFIPKEYSIEETAVRGPLPDQTKFGATYDPSEVSSLLERFSARNLIKGQKLCWSPDVPYVEGAPIRYYLDDSLLMIEWQEEEAGMVGTFSEIFVADGSQFRRKIAGDDYEYQYFYYATQLAQDANAVLAVGGDLYHHGRNCGIVVYNRTIYRFDPSTCDTCYIDSDGDMHFSYRNQFSTIDEAQRFVEENDIVYSLCFGPVMIDNSVDVTPDNYQWGEIWDTYARAAIGMLGEHHYLTMNLNCGTGHLYHYATLRQAADAMVERGCIKAYTLDGGQTCCTVVNGELVSPVQFGNERYTSDIIYFATAIAGNEAV